jgi:hypothetical protein
MECFGETPWLVSLAALCSVSRCRTVGGPTHLYAWPFPHKGRCLATRPTGVPPAAVRLLHVLTRPLSIHFRVPAACASPHPTA